MRLCSLKDLVAVSLKLSRCERIVVLGSSSLLVPFAELGESAGPLITTFDADIVHPDITRTLPPGWESRLVPFAGFAKVFCLDPYDLAAVKITVGRGKDLILVRALLKLGKIEAAKLRERFQTMPLGERELFKAGRNLSAILEELPQSSMSH